MGDGIRDISALAAVIVLIGFLTVFVWLFRESLLFAIPDPVYRALTRRFKRLEADRIARVLIRRVRRSVRVVAGRIQYQRFAHLRVRGDEYHDVHVHRLQYEAVCLNAINLEGAQLAASSGLSWRPGTRFELVLTSGTALGCVTSDDLRSPWSKTAMPASTPFLPTFAGADNQGGAEPRAALVIARTNPSIRPEVLTIPKGTPSTTAVVGHRWCVTVTLGGRTDSHVFEGSAMLLNVGRNPMSEVRLPVDQLDLSANHLQLVFDGAPAVIDVSSTGVRIRRAGQVFPVKRMSAPVTLLEGDVLELGPPTGETRATVAVERLG